MLQGSTFQFLKKLKNNNNRAWLETNKSVYEAAKADFELFITLLIAELAKTDSRYTELNAKQCIFRLNRDVRFSKNKDPYKTNFGASINLGGKKSMQAGFYLHIEPGNCFTGGGIYMPMPEALAKIRQEIDYNFVTFSKILANKSFQKYYTLGLDKSDALKKAPKGYTPDNEAVEFLKLKNFIAIEKLDDDFLCQKNTIKKITEYKTALNELTEFLNHAIA